MESTFVTIDYKGLQLTVEGDFQAPEPEVRYYSDGSGYPGCPAEFVIHDITLGEHSLYEILDDKLSEIEGLVIEKILNSEEDHY